MVARPTRKRMYRTMQGRMVDIEKLRAANETVQAVGNMNVNARGDIIGPKGAVVTSKETVIQKYYEQPKGRVDDTPSKGKTIPAPKTEPVKKTVQKMTPVASKQAPQKTTVSKPVESKPLVKKPVESKPVSTFKPKTGTTTKNGIDAALDGLE